MSDWIDDEKRRRVNGQNRPLLPSEHEAVNGRYPGTTLEYCIECGSATGCAGRGEDSNYMDDGSGPYCWECFVELRPNDGGA